MTLLESKLFTDIDQVDFARLSGDTNPLHMDPIQARRLLLGRPVVHGIHLLLCALEAWFASGGHAVRRISCTFAAPVGTESPVHIRMTPGIDRSVLLQAKVGQLTCTRIVLDAPGGRRGAAAVAALPAGRSVSTIGPLPTPLDLGVDDHLDKAYCATFDDGPPAAEIATARFPHAVQVIGIGRVIAIAKLSYIVGMVCPGLHSLFASLDIGLVDDTTPGEPGLSFGVAKYDKRVRHFEIDCHGRGIAGTISAFQRPAGAVQASMDALRTEVTGGEFSGSRSLVIGGSRGIGELTAKLLVAGGGRVCITYSQGAEDAARVLAEVDAFAPGLCQTMPLDVLGDSSGNPLRDPDGYTAVYYFASPRIYRKKAELFDDALLREFLSYYVDAFHRLCRDLEARSASSHGVRVFLPSTVFVAQRPLGMVEYAMAKAAAEVLAQEINRTFRRVSVVCLRLPRLDTDQTASLAPVQTESNVATMLEVVRAVNAQ